MPFSFGAYPVNDLKISQTMRLETCGNHFAQGLQGGERTCFPIVHLLACDEVASSNGRSTKVTNEHRFGAVLTAYQHSLSIIGEPLMFDCTFVCVSAAM